MWALVLWYRITRELEAHGRVRNADKKFVVLSHTTTDSIIRLARKHGLGVVKTWVGFASLAAGRRDVWEAAAGLLDLRDGRDAGRYKDLCHPYVCECLGMDNGKRSINVGAMEQSNGFSMLGGPPPDERSLGVGGHVRDKDGTFAALLVAEIAAWAKRQGTSILELLDKEIYLDPEIGLFINFYEPDPLDGEYPGIEGDRLKKAVLRRALGSSNSPWPATCPSAACPSSRPRCTARASTTPIYPPTYDFVFPDEGVRFFFDDDASDHLTVRPSGTGNSLRFHVQLHANPTAETLLTTKQQLRDQGKAILDDIRRLVKAPRER